MGATADDVAATTAVTPAPDGASDSQQGADSAPAVNDSDESTRDPKEIAQTRINELTRRRYDAERERDYWREQAQREQRAQPREEPRPEPAPEAGKTLADFGYDETKYQAHLFQLARSEAVKAAREELTKEQTQTRAQRRIAEFADREAKYSKDLPDYFEVTRGHVPVTAEMAETIQESELGPELAYHLGKNRDVAASIARLSPLQQARELGRLEAKLAAKPKAPQVSKAPAPAPKLEGHGDTGSFKPDDPESDKLSDAEWSARRKKQVARKR